MKRRVIKTPAAKADLVDHYVYIGQDNIAAAERFLSMAQDAFDQLAHHPRIGRPWTSNRPRLAGLRVWSVTDFRNYLIFYRPIRQGVEIVRVLHGARDLDMLL